MLFSRQHIIKLYYDGQTEPFATFTIESQHITTLDSHTIKSDGSILKFADDVFVSVSN
jgi:hypothetical protein